MTNWTLVGFCCGLLRMSSFYKKSPGFLHFESLMIQVIFYTNYRFMMGKVYANFTVLVYGKVIQLAVGPY